jgi:hypothetical protein
MLPSDRPRGRNALHYAIDEQNVEALELLALTAEERDQVRKLIHDH